MLLCRWSLALGSSLLSNKLKVWVNLQEYIFKIIKKPLNGQKTNPLSPKQQQQKIPPTPPKKKNTKPHHLRNNKDLINKKLPTTNIQNTHKTPNQSTSKINHELHHPSPQKWHGGREPEEVQVYHN